jgi:hypothetical protein
MRTIFVLILILILGYAGAHLHFYKSKFPLGTHYMMFAGSEYLFLGLLLGAAPLIILTPDIIRQLSPVVNLGLGWIGLLFGIQFNLAHLRRMPLRYMNITVFQAIFTFLLVWVGIIYFARFFGVNLSQTQIVLLAAIASMSSVTCLAFMQDKSNFPQPTQNLLYYISSLDSLLGLIILGLIIPGDLYQGWYKLYIYLLLSASLILIFHLLTRFHLNRKELLILTIGLVILSSGLAGTFGISALMLNFLLGAGLINLPSLNHRVWIEILHGQEKPIYIVFLVLAGAIWTPLSTQLLLLAAYLGFRFLGKVSSAWLASRLYGKKISPPSFWGLALFPQGGMGIAMAVDYLWYNPGKSGIDILNIVLTATLISQLLGPVAVRFGILRRIEA